ncbi:DUF2256 domain-containing protein [Aureimonas psammosilenae]|uniref:DUF2256 domain-containing protein n=1 Tax=Aureimonas psammosilenae TaxID=2495496 RepID=UPI0018698628|nr:DUF2256 domain-containing protein [Aureimonas psammosilenae]
MARMKAKGDLPVKPCRHCGRPMVWRKSWRANWDEVLYCSERCRKDAKSTRRSEETEETPRQGRS